ncbi:MAG: ABC transporter substrate-binding protein [Oscillospiraceae bacterium]|nr:ABC transporter substrate-binding protein [Oscillospiraceae bacterium]
MKKMIAVLMLLVLMISLFSGCSQKNQAGAEQVIKIGIYEPFTGKNASGGKQEALGISYANYIQPTVTINGTTYRIELVVSDNESSVEKAPTAATALVEHGVAVVLGSYGSDESMAGSGVFEAAGIPVVGVTCSNPAVTAGNQHYFRISWLDTFQGSALANFATEHLKADTVYCLAERDNNYSAGLCSYFISAFTSLGGSVVYETYPAGTTDFTPYIRAAQHAGAEVFFAPVSTESALWIITQAGEANLDMPILAGDTWDSNVVAAAGRSANQDIYVTTFFDENVQDEDGKVFVAGFRQYVMNKESRLAHNGGNTMVSAASAMGYDAYFAVLEAMKNAKSADPSDIREALWTVNYTGITGNISFDNENGDAVRTTAFIKKVDKDFGTWQFITVQTVG